MDIGPRLLERSVLVSRRPPKRGAEAELVVSRPGRWYQHSARHAAALYRRT